MSAMPSALVPITEVSGALTKHLQFCSTYWLSNACWLQYCLNSAFTHHRDIVFRNLKSSLLFRSEPCPNFVKKPLWKHIWTWSGRFIPSIAFRSQVPLFRFKSILFQSWNWNIFQFQVLMLPFDVFSYLSREAFCLEGFLSKCQFIVIEQFKSFSNFPGPNIPWIWFGKIFLDCIWLSLYHRYDL